MTAISFVLSDLETGRGLAHALICPDARYASIAWIGAERLDRRHVTGADWRLLELAIREKLPPTPLKSTHIVSRILLPEDRRSGIMVQYVAQVPMEIPSSRQTAEHLDMTLWSFVSNPAG